MFQKNENLAKTELLFAKNLAPYVFFLPWTIRRRARLGRACEALEIRLKPKLSKTSDCFAVYRRPDWLPMHVLRGLDNQSPWKLFLLFWQLQALKTRLNGAHVQCEDLLTPWAGFAHAPIIYLDRQDVKCAEGKFLARFHLFRENIDAYSNVRFEYRCCQFIL